MVNKRKKKKMINRMKNLLWKEAKKQAACLKALCEIAGNEKPRKRYLKNFDDYLQKAMCMEVVWNNMVGKLDLDCDEMPTHNTFHEAERIQREEWIAIGRDSGVRAIHKFQKEIIANDDLWNDLQAINLFGDSNWEGYGDRCPVCNSRFYTRERRYYDQHADGTANWQYNYQWNEGEHYECFLAVDGSHEDLGWLYDTSLLDIDNYLDILQPKDFLDTVPDLERFDMGEPTSQTAIPSVCYYYYSDTLTFEDLDSIYFNYLLKEFKKQYFTKRKRWILEKIGWFKRFTDIKSISDYLEENN